MAIIKGDTHIVLKVDDTQKYLTEDEQILLQKLCEKVESRRLDEGKTVNRYYVCNMDEPYANNVLHSILKGEDDKGMNCDGIIHVNQNDNRYRNW
jgi:hypothetical protein